MVMVLEDNDARFGFSVMGGDDEGFPPRIDEIGHGKFAHYYTFCNSCRFQSSVTPMLNTKTQLLRNMDAKLSNNGGRLSDYRPLYKPF